nr:hypothetical protein CFP56_71836 [Quercus suber]
MSNGIGIYGSDEGRIGSGWRGSGLHLRRTLEPASLASQGQHHRQLKPIVVATGQNNHDGRHNKPDGGIKGKEKVAVFQNSKTHASSYPHRDKCDLYSEKAKAKIGAKFMSNINGKIKTDTLTLDLFLRVKRGNGGKWNIVSSKVREVDRKVLNNRPNYKTMAKPNLNEMGNTIKGKGNNYWALKSNTLALTTHNAKPK